MSTTQPSSANVELVVRLWNQIWIEGDLEQVGEIVADTYIRHTRDGSVTASAADYAQHIGSVIQTIRGTDLSIEHIASDADMVFARLTLEGVNLSTGNTVRITWLAQYRIADGRIAESWTMHQSDLDW